MNDINELFNEMMNEATGNESAEEPKDDKIFEMFQKMEQEINAVNTYEDIRTALGNDTIPDESQENTVIDVSALYNSYEDEEQAFNPKGEEDDDTYSLLELEKNNVQSDTKDSVKTPDTIDTKDKTVGEQLIKKEKVEYAKNLDTVKETFKKYQKTKTIDELQINIGKYTRNGIDITKQIENFQDDFETEFDDIDRDMDLSALESSSAPTKLEKPDKSKDSSSREKEKNSSSQEKEKDSSSQEKEKDSSSQEKEKNGADQTATKEETETSNADNEKPEEKKENEIKPVPKKLREYKKEAKMDKIIFAKPVEEGSFIKKAIKFGIVCIAVGIFLGIKANSYYNYMDGKVDSLFMCVLNGITSEAPISLAPINEAFSTGFLIGTGGLGIFGLMKYLDTDAKNQRREGHEHGNARLGTPNDFKSFKIKFME